MRPESLHLTLAFVGSVSPPQLEVLRHIGEATRANAFELCLDRLGFWRSGGILWVGCARVPAQLNSLAENLDGRLRAAGIGVERKGTTGLVPHVTLARRAHHDQGLHMGSPIRWRVGSFALVESHLQEGGASYRTLASFPLIDSA